MQHFSSLEGVHLHESWLTIGSFDGVHLGHQEIIMHLVSEAHSREALAVAMAFFPHPAIVLGKRQNPLYLTTIEERAEIMGEMGVDVVITYPFDLQTANLSAREFIALLHEHIKFEGLCVGHDFASGKNREGNTEKLSLLGQEFGYQVELIAAVKNDDVIVSSSGIRTKILEGEIEQAMQKTGVYAAWAKTRDRPFEAVVNIGVRPTFEPETSLPRVEAHVLDFHEEIYGEEIILSFVARLRDERRFPNIEALVEQIRYDISRTKQLLL